MRRSRRRTTPKISRVSKSFVPGTLGIGVAALAALPASGATFNVTTLNDNGAGSLRDAIQQANGAAGADVITFQPGLTGTITLTTGQLAITDSLDIQGPGASVLSVSGNNSSRVFYMYSGSALLDIRVAGLTITQGTANIGGGVVNFDENLLLENVTIIQNTATGDGGGLWADGFSMNLTIRNSTISGNTSGSDGGGIYIEDTGGPLLIENCVVTGNQAADDGGGIYFYDPDNDTTIRGTTVSGNTAGDSGGGIYLYSPDAGSHRIETSTFSGNSAQSGGGLFLYSPDQPFVIENTTISGNQALAGSGGGMYLYNFYAAMSVNFVTIASNTATVDGGGLFINDGTLSISNSIIGDNTAPAPGADLDGGATAAFDLSYTLVESTASGATLNNLVGNALGVDPQLGPLVHNGGPTQTHRPTLISPAVNAADPGIATPLTDQRGQPREYPVRADMGALELVGGVFQFNPTTASVAENGGSVMLTVVRDVGPDPATVNYTTTPGTANPGAGNDYTTSSGTLVFLPGDLSETFNVPILDDAVVEGNEQFTASINLPSADATVGPASSATVTITDFEPGQFVFSSPTYSVGESGGFLTVTVNRVGGSDGPASVNYSTANASATAGSDYTTAAGTLNWGAGDTAPKTFNIPIIDDAASEGAETFTVSLNTPSAGASIGSPGSATVTITDSPSGTVQFNVATVNTTEESITVVLTVTRTGGTEGALVVNYATADGTATAPSDYTSAAGTLTFPDGSAASQTITITLINDSVQEGQEMFSVNLTGAGVGAPSSVSVVLAASDAANVPTMSLFGKIFFAMMSMFAGLYAIMRKGLSAVLLAALLAGLVAVPDAFAGEKAKPKQTKAQASGRNEHRGSKLNGKIQSIANNGGNLVLGLSGGVTLTLPSNKIEVVDAKRDKRVNVKLDALAVGAGVVVKVETAGDGSIKHVRIKIIS